MEIRPVEAELFHAARRTDMMKLIVAFRNFVNAPRKIIADCQKFFQNPERFCTLWLDVDF
jgi:hypothetical protein